MFISFYFCPTETNYQNKSMKKIIGLTKLPDNIFISQYFFFDKACHQFL